MIDAVGLLNYGEADNCKCSTDTFIPLTTLIPGTTSTPWGAITGGGVRSMGIL